MIDCLSCQHSGTPSYKSPCSECKDNSKYEHKKTPTNGEYIRSMSDEELAEFIKYIAFARETPWSGLFEKKFCKNCPTTHVTFVDSGKEMECTECDFSDGKCPHGDDVVWWLGEPYKEQKGR